MPREKKPAAIAMPILALRGLMVFPHMVLHFDVGREKSVAALEQAMMESQEIFLVAQRDADVEDPTVDQLCRVGTIAHIKQVLNLPGDSLRVLVEGLRRATLETITQEEPYLLGKVRPEPERPEEESIEMQALVRTTQDFFAGYAAASQRVSAETVNSVREVEAPDQLADVIAANVLTHLEDRQAILEELDVKTRLEKLCTILARETELAGVEKQVQARIKKQIEKNQKDYYLREQIKAIQTELGDKEATDVEDLRDRLEHTPVNDEAREKLQKELERLSRMGSRHAGSGCEPHLGRMDSGSTLGQDHDGQPGSKACAEGAFPGPLWSGQGEGTHRGVSGRAAHEAGHEGADSVLCGPARRG